MRFTGVSQDFILGYSIEGKDDKRIAAIVEWNFGWQGKRDQESQSPTVLDGIKNYGLFVLVAQEF